MNRNRAARVRRRRALEPLEPRTLLAGDAAALSDDVAAVLGFDAAARLAAADASLALLGNGPGSGAAGLPLTVSSGLPITSGFPRATTASVDLTGTADPISGSIYVSALPADWNSGTGAWSIAGVPLNPGINRLLVQSFAGGGGTGGELMRTYYDVWYDSSAGGGATFSFPTGSVWKYRSDGTDLAAAWRSEAYDDSAWLSGAGQLGYGDGDETTLIDGGPADDRYRTSYFRRTFTVPAGQAAQFTQGSISGLYDDGISVFLNGVEIARADLPGALGDNSISYSTLATSTRENRPLTASFDPALLHDGANTLAVEVHQRAVDSSDLSFDLSLVASSIPPGGTNVSGTLPAGTTTWQAAAGPYNVTADVTVPVGATLVIEPGTSVFFASGAGISVAGRLLAEGTDTQRIQLTRAPGATHRWDGLRLTDSLNDSRMSYFDMGYGDTQGEDIAVTRAQLAIDHGAWYGTNTTVLEVLNPSLVVRNSVIPGISSGEVIHGEYIEGSEYLIFDGNVFGASTGNDDVFDFSGAERPGPVLQILNNVFNGGGDDGIDLDGTDAHVEGNVFRGFHYNTSRQTTSNGIATGLPQSGEPWRTQITAVRNLFYDNDHAILLKEEAFLTAVNNVFADSSIAAVQFTEVGGTAVQGPGMGGYFDGNIFYNNAQLFRYVEPTTVLSVNRSIVPTASLGLGSGNSDADPLFVDPAGRDYRLQPGSPALAAGYNGLDMGYDVPAGASIDGEPASPTMSTSATLTVGGPDKYAYRYRVNGGAWSAPVAVANPGRANFSIPPIQLTTLADGQYTVEVITQDSAGNWQPESQATRSQTWTVQTAPPASVVGRHVFYNNSTFDGSNPAANSGDDAAIADDKAALLPGSAASFANYTSYSKGINGLMVDVADLAGTPTSADFVFRTGNNNSPSTWAVLATAAQVSVRPGAGVGGSDRVTLVWPDGTITNRWLQVTTLSGTNTGLPASDVFYVGNAVGEAGNSTTDAVVNAADEIAARANPVGPFPTAPLGNRHDFNRDRLVNATDQIIARTNSTNPLTALRLISPPAESGAGAAAAEPLPAEWGAAWEPAVRRRRR